MTTPRNKEPIHDHLRLSGDGSRSWPLNNDGRCAFLECDAWGTEVRQATGGCWVYYCPAHRQMADGIFGPFDGFRRR